MRVEAEIRIYVAAHKDPNTPSAQAGGFGGTGTGAEMQNWETSGSCWEMMNLGFLRRQGELFLQVVSP